MSWKDCFNNVQNCEADKGDLLEQLLQWKSKRDAFNMLIAHAEEALSPRQLLYEHPLNRMSEENKKWFGEVIHGFYCLKTKIKDKMSELQAKMNEIDQLVDSAALILRENNNAQKLTGDKIINAFMDFSKSISELPHDIVISVL